MLTKPFPKWNQVFRHPNAETALQTIMNYYWNNLTRQVYSQVKPKTFGVYQEVGSLERKSSFSMTPCALALGIGFGYQEEATEISVLHFSELTADANISSKRGTAHPICKRLMTKLSKESKWFFVHCMNGVYLNESVVFQRVWG